MASTIRAVLVQQPRPARRVRREKGSAGTKVARQKRPMTSLTLVRRIAARPSIVFEALTTPEGIAQWWGPDAGPVLMAETDVRTGGHFKVRFRMLDGTEHESSGEYLEVKPPERLAMTWRWLGLEDDGGESRIEIDLRPVNGGTELVFTHAMLSSEESRQGHTEGWNGALDKLEKYLLSHEGVQ